MNEQQTKTILANTLNEQQAQALKDKARSIIESFFAGDLNQKRTLLIAPRHCENPAGNITSVKIKKYDCARFSFKKEGGFFLQLRSESKEENQLLIQSDVFEGNEIHYIMGTLTITTGAMVYIFSNSQYSEKHVFEHLSHGSKGALAKKKHDIRYQDMVDMLNFAKDNDHPVSWCSYQAGNEKVEFDVNKTLIGSFTQLSEPVDQFGVGSFFGFIFESRVFVFVFEEIASVTFAQEGNVKILKIFLNDADKTIHQFRFSVPNGV